MPEIRLYAILREGPAPIEPPAGAAGVNEAFDDLPPGVYSGLRTFDHERFLRLDLHMARTHRSALASGWDDFDERLLRLALHETARAYPLPEARVRFDVLAQPVDFACGPSRMLIGLSPLAPIAEELLLSGVHVGLARDLRRETPRVKTTDFVRRRRPYPLGTRESYEHLLLDEADRILEGTSSNIFGLRKGVLRTAGTGVLEGVTRDIVLELAAELALPVRLEPIALDELARLDEAFLTSSSRGLVPIVSAAGTRIGAGLPGPLYRRLREAYERYAEREARPAVEAL